MIRPPPRSTRTDTLFPYTTLFRALADGGQIGNQRRADPAVGAHLDLSAQFRVAPHEDLQFVERTDDIFLSRSFLSRDEIGARQFRRGAAADAEIGRAHV